MDLLVYAETPGLSQIYYSVWDFYPYEVTSTSYDDVPAGSTLVIDMDFGKPPGAPGLQQNRNVSSGSRFSSLDAAKAFVIHEEMYEYSRQFQDRSWPADIFDEQVGSSRIRRDLVLRPLHEQHQPGDGRLDGLWRLAAATEVEQQLRRLQRVPLHGAPRVQPRHPRRDHHPRPAGLNMPASHSPLTDSNHFLAWTEGFADFLSLVTIGQTNHMWEFSRQDAGGLPVLTGNHFKMEGEVTGFLWDLCDPVGYEPLRHPATRSSGGTWDSPPSLVQAQMF